MMMKIKFSLVPIILNIALFFSVLSTLSHAEKISVVMTVDKTELSMEDQLEISVSVRGQRKSAEPQILNVNDFEVTSQGSSSRVNIINGNVSSENLFQFGLYPKKPGLFQIGPAVVTLGQNKYESESIEVKVTQSSASPSEQGRKSYYYIKATVDKSEPYVNEQVTFTFQLFSRAQLANARLEFPGFNGFWKESLGNQKEYRKILNGVEWTVTEIKTALFPLSTGPIQIPPTQLHAQVFVQRRQREDPFFDSFFFQSHEAKPIRLVSEPIKIKVKPLPSLGKPAHFSSLVGTFSLQHQLSKNTVAAGESVTLTLVLEGEGNVRDAKLEKPSSPDLKVYEDEPFFEAKVKQDRIVGKKIFKWALVPLKEGQISFPAPEISYFNPQSASYQALKAELPPLRVLEGTAEKFSLVSKEELPNRRKKIEVLGEDLMPIKRGLSALRAQMLSSQERYLLLALVMFFPMGFMGLWFLRKHRDRISSDKGYFKRGKAFHVFQSSIKKLKGGTGFYEEASLLLRNYLGDKLDFDGKALTPIDIERKLKPLNISEDLVRRTQSFLEQCEKGQYGGIFLGQDEEKSMKSSLSDLVLNLEKEIRT